jgi:hypothetical protein
MVLDYSKANRLQKRHSSGSSGHSSNETSGTQTPEERVLDSTGHLSSKESVEARHDCDVAYMTEETISGMPKLYPSTMFFR